MTGSMRMREEYNDGFVSAANVLSNLLELTLYIRASPLTKYTPRMSARLQQVSGA